MSYVIALTGFPGVGKLTTALAIKAETERVGGTALVVDNHWINNPIFGLIDQDGMTPLPADVWDQVGVVATAVFSTLERHTPRSWNIILTAYLDGHTDTGWLPAVKLIATARHATFLPVRLVCDVDENVRRITMPQRRNRMKSIDPDEPRRLAARGAPYDLGEGSLTIDTTEGSPDDTARAILSALA